MSIQVLDKKTIDQIAAGEVIERPMSVVKELVENSIDAGSRAISVEIKNGGIDFIRVSDDGRGIEKEDLKTAFLPHATSKIRTTEDLNQIHTLGFRGEALPSIASVSKMEVITKTEQEITGFYYAPSESASEVQEMGAPDGTTFLVEHLFYNVPARRKFLKTPMTEGSYIVDLMEKMALSHPDISFQLTMNGQTKISTNGSGKLRELIYGIYGRETLNAVLDVDADGPIQIRGVLGKPVLAKGNRSFENIFLNGRCIKNKILQNAIEDAYAPFMMQHRYPFTVLYIETDPKDFDVNVHPTKSEVRFSKEREIYDAVFKAVSEALKEKEFIEETSVSAEKKEEKKAIYKAPEPFEYERRKEDSFLSETGGMKKSREADEKEKDDRSPEELFRRQNPKYDDENEKVNENSFTETSEKQQTVQKNLFEEKLLTQEGMKKHRLIGQVFQTYWLLEMDDKLYIMDQHAAHEKVLYERKMKEFSQKKIGTQMVAPPIIVSLSSKEEMLLNRYMDEFSSLGYEISNFGGKEYAISGVPSDLYNLDVKSFFTEVLSGLEEEYKSVSSKMIVEKIASLSCKAAIKGNEFRTMEEAEKLLEELLTLENPYACPHGRPTLIAITRHELEVKFKRIV